MATGFCNPASSSPALLFVPACCLRRRRRPVHRLPSPVGSPGTAATAAGGGSPAGERLLVRCGIAAVNQAEFAEVVLKSEVPVLVEFVADWCGLCRLISPVIEWTSQEYKDRLKVVKIDHDADLQLIEQYKVYSLPALILFKEGQEVPERLKEGAVTEAKLKEYLDSLLV